MAGARLRSEPDRPEQARLLRHALRIRHAERNDVVAGALGTAGEAEGIRWMV